MRVSATAASAPRPRPRVAALAGVSSNFDPRRNLKADPPETLEYMRSLITEVGGSDHAGSTRSSGSRAGNPIKVWNREVLNDSKLSLDVWARAQHILFMPAQPYCIYTERKDASRNIARFYAMSVEGDLFGKTALVR